MKQIAITLSYHVQYEGYTHPQTLCFERAERENDNEFKLRIFRSIITHTYGKAANHDEWSEVKLFVSVNSLNDEWNNLAVRKGLKRLFNTTRINLIDRRIH